MRRVVIDGHRILLGAHIDEFVIACANLPVLDAFQTRLLEAFEGTYEGPLEHYLGCEIARDTIAGTTTLSQRHYADVCVCVCVCVCMCVCVRVCVCVCMVIYCGLAASVSPFSNSLKCHFPDLLVVFNFLHVYHLAPAASRVPPFFFSNLYIFCLNLFCIFIF